MADISKLRALHDIKQNFVLQDHELESLTSQLAEDDQSKVDRFFSGFEIEDWFEAIFGIMPWTRLLHGLSQRQVPTRSKSDFQVPDFTALIETSTFKTEPLLIEVKRVARNKQTLKLRKSQVAPTKEYAEALGIPLVYAIYWDSLRAWTLNTVDAFENKSSTFKISNTTAFESDCSLIFGDMCYLVTQQLFRSQTFASEPVVSPPLVHESYGGLVSDEVVVDGISHSLSGVQSVVLDAMFGFTTTSRRTDGPRTIIHSETRETFLFRLSGWITRYLSLYQTAPTEPYANAAAHEIIQLMERIGIPQVMMYPTDRSTELSDLDAKFLHPPEAT